MQDLCGKYEAVCKYGDVLTEAEFPLGSGALRPLTVAGRRPLACEQRSVTEYQLVAEPRGF